MDLEMPAILENDFEGYRCLLEIFHKTREDANERVVLNFLNNTKFDLNLFAVIVAYAELLISQNSRLAVKNCKDSPFLIKLDEYLQKPSPSPLEDNIPFLAFPVHQIQEFYDYMEETIFENPSVKKIMSAPLANVIASNLGEVFGNVGTHTATDKVFCCGQIDISRKKLDFSIVNLGTTIPENVTRYTQRKDIAQIPFAIEWAVGENNTTKETTGGIGLHTLQTYIGKTGGKLQIVSGNEFYELHGNKVTNRLFSSSFCGTIVNVEFYLKDKKSYLTTKDNKKCNVNDLL